MAIRIEVPRELCDELRKRPAAARIFRRLEDDAANDRAIPDRLFKLSGASSRGVFEPYRVLGLHHAKLDFKGRNGGDPLLVLQRIGRDRFAALALTTHRSYASSDFTTCRRWLWEHRGLLDWTLDENAGPILDDLTTEFDPAVPSGRRGR